MLEIVDRPVSILVEILGKSKIPCRWFDRLLEGERRKKTVGNKNRKWNKKVKERRRKNRGDRFFRWSVTKTQTETQKEKEIGSDGSRMKRHRVGQRASSRRSERRPLYFLEAGPIGDFEVDKSQLISGA